jgi:hypothetical protein
MAAEGALHPPDVDPVGLGGFRSLVHQEARGIKDVIAHRQCRDEFQAPQTMSVQRTPLVAGEPSRFIRRRARCKRAAGDWLMKNPEKLDSSALTPSGKEHQVATCHHRRTWLMEARGRPEHLLPGGRPRDEVAFRRLILRAAARFPITRFMMDAAARRTGSSVD